MATLFQTIWDFNKYSIESTFYQIVIMSIWEYQLYLSFTVSSLSSHVLNTSSYSNCGNILNYSTCASLRRDVTKQRKAILSAITKLNTKLNNVAIIVLGNQESIENLTKNVNQLLLQGYHILLFSIHVKKSRSTGHIVPLLHHSW